MSLFFCDPTDGYGLYNVIQADHKNGNLADTMYIICNFKYDVKVKTRDELYYFCQVGNFLIDNRLYNHYLNFISHSRINKQIMKSHCNDENMVERLKLFERIYIANTGDYLSFATYKLLFENIINKKLIEKYKIKDPSQLELEFEEIHDIQES